jgi:ribosomal protein RSM22 (predicted rRNA methylase)
MLSLPGDLESAIGEALLEVPSSQWMSQARALSERYRGERGEDRQPLARGKSAALGYAALVLPAAYAQLSGAMSALAERAPRWQPASILDIGSGPGTALWAAAERWPSVKAITAWEREPAFIELGQRLARASEHASVSGARWQQVTLGGRLPSATPKYDLVVIGHVLNELGADLRREVVDFAWEHCDGVLLIVEPGTSAAFPIVKEAREQLLAQGAKTLAPCAHDRECPLVGDWCHFPQRLHRPAFQRRAKEGSAGWEESKFSYAAMARFPPDETIWGRLIHQPQVHKGYVELPVSSREGIVHPRLPRRDRSRFRQAASYKWGDALEEAVRET